ncbi:MAG: CBS domain-containing protein, partial [Deltaproteobacteria bacterium]|nr:CBS domain-containing protein [Deltaproteobacteria bacterium]
CLAGILTDGDLRRLLTHHKDPLALPVVNVMTKNPKLIFADKLAASALKIMEDAKITSLFVMPELESGKDQRKPLGIIHLHDLLRAGVV